jgi:CO/xanthine dehydrogenase FAD-binding subunit
VKPAAFRYFAPGTIDEARALLHRYPEARPLAGGQSLIPAMNFRLARPEILVDLGRIADLRGITPTDDGGVQIGAMTPQRQAEHDEFVAARCPLLHEALPWIGHAQIRNRGTIGGSIAHADPSAEIPAVLLALDAALLLSGEETARRVPAEEFFLGPMHTALIPGELLLAVHLSAPPRGAGHAFEEVSRRRGDYALVGAATRLVLDADGRTAAARIALLSVDDRPVRSAEAEAVLVGEVPGPECIAEAAAAAAASVSPPSDLHASAEYRRHLVRVLVQRTVHRATLRAREAE